MIKMFICNVITIVAEVNRELWSLQLVTEWFVPGMHKATISVETISNNSLRSLYDSIWRMVKLVAREKVFGSLRYFICHFADSYFDLMREGGQLIIDVCNDILLPSSQVSSPNIWVTCSCSYFILRLITAFRGSLESIILFDIYQLP